MSTNFPPDQTVVLKGLRKNITQPEVQRFVKDATPYVQSIHMSQDKYPPKDTHPVLAYLNYQVFFVLMWMMIKRIFNEKLRGSKENLCNIECLQFSMTTLEFSRTILLACGIAACFSADHFFFKIPEQ